MESTTVINPLTGEVVDESISVEEMDDASLVSVIEFYREQVKVFSQHLKCAEMVLATRMEEKEATVLIAGAYTVKSLPSVRYEYDMPRLLMLSEFLPKEQLETAIRYEPKVSKTALNKLAKLGGEVKKIIEESTTAIPGMPKLSIERRDI
jgi:hypothetical protein